MHAAVQRPHFFSTPCVLVTHDGKIIGVLVGRPDDPTYLKSTEVVFDEMVKEGEAEGFHQPLAHRCGEFVAVNVGVTHNTGTLCPVYLDGKSHKDAVDRLLALEELQRMANFASGSPSTSFFFHAC